MQKKEPKQKPRFSVKYPKSLLLLITIILAALIFHSGTNYPPFHDFLTSLGLFGDFIAGFFYSFGFTAAPATTVLLVLAKEQNAFIAAIFGGLGALISDILIFYFVRLSFSDELKKFEKEKQVIRLKKLSKRIFGSLYKYVLPALAGFIISSPLPSEVGISLLASLEKFSVKKFMLFAYILHTFGILLILLLGNLL